MIFTLLGGRKLTLICLSILLGCLFAYNDKLTSELGYLILGLAGIYCGSNVYQDRTKK